MPVRRPNSWPSCPLRCLSAPPPADSYHRVHALTSRSIYTLKADADFTAFRASGQGIVRADADSGIAPEAKLISLKVLDPDGEGEVSNILAALDHIQQVDRLVHSGVSVVVAAGNSGYDPSSTCLALTINDPANAELAITVGSTHRDRPHSYGVSYFSSKGPTGDGRRKPDLVAPGERIVSCAAPAKTPPGQNWRTAYVEDAGTSMAAAHVSGAIAVLLSVRCEFIGESQAIKEILLASATDLRRLSPPISVRSIVPESWPTHERVRSHPLPSALPRSRSDACCA